MVHAIALGPEADQALMQEIASTTGGDYLYVDLAGAGGSIEGGGAGGFLPPSLSLPNRLSESYRAVNETVRRHQRLWEASGVLKGGESRELAIPVEEDDLLDPVFTFSWIPPGTKLEARLFRPDGSEVLGGPGVLVLGDASHTAFQIEKAVKGTWRARLASPKAAEFVGVLSARNRLGVHLQVFSGYLTDDALAQRFRGRYLRGIPMPIIAGLTQVKGGAVKGAEVTARIAHPDGIVDLLQLLDDGSHGDGAADDGIYANLYTRTTAGSAFGVDDRDKDTPGKRGSYLVRVTATGISSGGGRFERHKATTFHVFEFDPN